MLPEEARVGMRAACRLYMKIGDKVRQQLATDVLSRARTGTIEKLEVLLALTLGR